MSRHLRGLESRVGFAELFFDLVFVFAVTQVSHSLLQHFDARGAMEAMLLFLAIWWVWIYTTWVLNRLDPESVPVRMMLFSLMAAGLFLSMAIPQAFGDRGLVFAVAYVAMQVGRSLFVLRVGRSDRVLAQSYLRITIWMCLSGVLWLAGALADPGARFSWWAAALALEYLAPWLAYRLPGLGHDITTNWTVKGAHMAERCGLFVIICLGEALLVSGATFAARDWDGPGLAAFLASVLGSIGMWWVYFHIGHKRASHQIETSDDPGRIARLSFTYAHIPIVAGVVLAAVGAERAIAHPSDLAARSDLLAIFGSNILFLAGNGWFKRLSARWFPLSHYTGLGLSVAGLLAGGMLPLWLAQLGSALVLVIVAFWEDRSLSGKDAAAA